MNALQRSTIQTLKRMRMFLTTEPIPVPLRTVPPGFATQLQNLQSVIAQADDHSMDQESGEVHQRVKQRRSLREVLRLQHLQPIRNVARVLERYTPGMPRLVNLPSRNVSEAILLSIAKATRRDIEPYEQLFIQKGFPTNFLSQLSAAITAVEQTTDSCVDARTKKVAGRQGINHALTLGKEVRQCLTAIVRRCCNADPVHGPATLRAWRSVSRIWLTNAPGPDAPVTSTEPSAPLKSLPAGEPAMDNDAAPVQAAA